MSHVSVQTHEYEFSHSKQPRGDGFWFFNLVGRDREESFCVHGNYAACLAKAKKVAIKGGFHTVSVQP